MPIHNIPFSAVEAAHAQLEASRAFTMRIAADPRAMALQSQAAGAAPAAGAPNGTYDEAGEWTGFFAFGGPFGLPLR